MAKTHPTSLWSEAQKSLAELAHSEQSHRYACHLLMIATEDVIKSGDLKHLARALHAARKSLGDYAVWVPTLKD